MNRLCFIQTHYTNINKEIKDNSIYCVDRIKESKLFDDIILAGANISENKILVEKAKEWDIGFYLGSTYNLVDRMLGALEETKTDVLARILLEWFFVDTELIEKMLNKIEETGADYVNLPYNFDIKFGADVVSKTGLIKLKKIFSQNKKLLEEFQFRPWQYIEENQKEFKTITCEEVPTYSNKKFRELKNRLIEVWPSRWDYGSTFQYSDYIFATKYLRKDDVVLDIACGGGEGSRVLSRYCKKVIGIDIDKKLIEKLQKKNRDNKITFKHGDGQNLDIGSNSIDKVVSIHTMEHIEDDLKFLKEIKRVLKSDGIAIIEVPLRMKYPFFYTKEPFMPGHEKEYTLSELEDRVERVFDPSEIYGANRGHYCDISKARNAVTVVCKNKND